MPIVLRPSAAERAAKDCTGKTAAYYTSLFTTHAECELAQRNKPLPRKKISELPVIFQNLELQRLRQQVMKTFFHWCGSEEAARKVNAMSEQELLKYLPT